jgi:uncharacterized RDD family membrane protein YckC
VSEIGPGWYRDPSEPETQRYWDGEGWIGDPLPVDAVPPDGPPAEPTPPAAAPDSPAPADRDLPAAGTRPGSPASVRSESTTAGRTESTAGRTESTTAGRTESPAGAPHSPAGTDLASATATREPGAVWPPPVPAGVHYPGAGDESGWRPPPGWPAGLPAPRPHGLPLASIGGRVAARLIDIAAVAALAVAANAWFAWQWWKEFRPLLHASYQAVIDGQPQPELTASGRAGNLQLVMLLLTMLAWFVYEVPAHAGTGQTPGKKVMGIKVMRAESTEPLGFGRAWRRWNPLGLPTLLWSCCGLGFLWQFLVCLPAVRHPLRQGWHDRAAQTVVVALPQGDPTVPPATPGGTP